MYDIVDEPPLGTFILLLLQTAYLLSLSSQKISHTTDRFFNILHVTCNHQINLHAYIDARLYQLVNYFQPNNDTDIVKCYRYMI